jgi:hypothetical protein
MQSWVVPAGVTRAHFDISGAAGGDSNSQYGPYAGKGGRAETGLPLTPGSTVHIAVGGKGTYRDNCCSGAGYNGGGAGSRLGGGGATDIRIGGTSLLDRVLVAGGGGAAGDMGGLNGGDGGGLTGTPGTGAGGGAGGTQTAGGSGIYPIWSGSFGQGGSNGGSPNATAGGGGGWYGGAASRTGGGGSGAGPSGTHFSTGVNGGNGSATITVVEHPPTGLYRGSSVHGQVWFDLSHDYTQVRSFRVGGDVLFHAAQFHFGGTNSGSFNTRTPDGLHIVGHWSGDRLGHVSGHYSFEHHGHHFSVHWSADPAS